MIQPVRFVWLPKKWRNDRKIYEDKKLIRTYTKLVSYKEQKKFYSFLSFDNLSAERFLNYLLAIYAFLNFDLLSLRSLNFPKISASFLIRPFFMIGAMLNWPN